LLTRLLTTIVESKPSSRVVACEGFAMSKPLAGRASGSPNSLLMICFGADVETPGNLEVLSDRTGCGFASTDGSQMSNGRVELTLSRGLKERIFLKREVKQWPQR
jgi:hypothetical protein